MTLTDTLQLSSVATERPTTGRPRLLFLARSFPPARASSCTRTWNIAKHLSRLGWEVTVVTPHPSVWRHIDNPQDAERKVKKEGIKRILTDHRWRCLANHNLKTWNKGLGHIGGGLFRAVSRRLGVDDGIGWIAPAEKACSCLSRGDVDLILATAHPVSVFKLAEKLSKRLGCPYVMDYRDPWTQNPHRRRATQATHIQEEAHLLAGSAAVTIVSRSWAEVLMRQHRINGKLHLITNGYDPEDLAEVEPTKFDHFAIVYTGVFYPPKRVVTPIMEALKLLKENDPPLSDYFFHYYGPHRVHVREEAQRNGVSDRIILHGEVSQSIALSAVRGAGVAVVITSVSENAIMDEQGIVTGKIFEPIGLKTPVLLISPEGSDAEVVLRTAGLGQAFRGTDVGGIAKFLRNLISGHELRQTTCGEYSWQNIAKKLDCILKGVLENNSARQAIEAIRHR